MPDGSWDALGPDQWRAVVSYVVHELGIDFKEWQRSQDQALHELETRVARLEVRVGLYGAIAGTVGGGAMAVLVALLH